MYIEILLKLFIFFRFQTKIANLKNNVSSSNEQNKIWNKKDEINENMEKLIQKVQETDFINRPLDKEKDIKKSIENTIIDVFSRNQKLEELIEEMKKGFNLKNKQIL